MRICNHNCTLVNNCCICNDKRTQEIYTKYIYGIGSIPCPRNEFYCVNCKNESAAIQWASSIGDLKLVKLLYWRYPVSKRRSIREMLPMSKKLWQDVSNCELLPLPWEIIEVIKRLNFFM
jgi:hypothetical protein